MKILIAGASGFIGKYLVPSLIHAHDITILGRDINRIKKCFPNRQAIDWQSLEKETATDYQAIINLCGENIGDKRWSQKQKSKILDSRINTTKKLCDWALTSKKRESLHFINASAVGIYGLSTKNNTENTPIEMQKNCFSQQVVSAWEETAKEKLANNINYTLTRFGVVLKKQEGMLKKLEIPYKLGLASTLGDGKQQISWIHIDDLVQSINFILAKPELSGQINIVAPEVVTQKQLAKTLAGALHRPCFLKTPSIFIKLLFGQMGKELLLSGQEVTANRLQAAGFSFKYPTLKQAIYHEYQKNRRH